MLKESIFLIEGIQIIDAPIAIGVTKRIPTIEEDVLKCLGILLQEFDHSKLIDTKQWHLPM